MRFKRPEKEPELGKKYRCKISGYEGIATSRTEFLNGCVRYALAGKADPNDTSKEPPVFSFDVEELEPVESEPVSVKSVPTGGPQDRVAPRSHR